MRWPTFALILTTAVLGDTMACGQPRRLIPSGGSFYDTTPWMASLRPSARAGLAQAAGVASLDLLPRYELALSYVAATRAFTLREEVWFTNRERAPLRDLVLRVYANATQSGSAPRAAGAPIRFVRGSCVDAAAPCAVTQEAPSVLLVRLGAPLPPGGRVRVAVELSATLPEIDGSRTNILAQGMESLSMLGAHESASDYGLLAVGDGVVSMANFYAVLARRERGRWERDDRGHVGDLGSDELSNVHAVIEAPANHVVVTTGSALGNTALAGDRRRVEVGAVAVRDFCVMMGQTLQSATRRVGDVEVRSWFLPADSASGERVLDAAAGALEVFERRFGAYPYSELDVVEAALVGGAGGVEFPGLVTVASMFYHPPQLTGLTGGLASLMGVGDSITQSMSQMLPAMLEFVTAHEVAHQFWHGLVGSDSRAHPFIDESLAQWSAALYLEDRYGAERARRDADMNVRMNYQLMRMMGEDDGPVDRPTSAFASPMRYAGIVYGKGPYVYNALREAAGDAVFFRGVARYVATWRFRTAPSTGFVDALAAENATQGPRYRQIARRWLQESHGDEDMGRADLATLLAPMMGGGAATPEMREAMEMLGPILQSLGGARAAPSGAPRTTPHGASPGAQGAPGAEVPSEGVERLLEQLMREQ